MSDDLNPDLVVLDARVYTADSTNLWAEAFAVTAGKIVAVGTFDEISAMAGPVTTVERLDGRFVLNMLAARNAVTPSQVLNL